MRRWIGVLLVAVPVCVLIGVTARSQVQLLDKSEFRTAIEIGDAGALEAGASSPTGTKRPPRVGPNVRANATQVGLLGRSETTVAATDDGQLLVAGWNDAQGFCGPPFGSPCTPQNPPGLSGFGFSMDGGLSWTDGGGPSLLGTNILTRGDPWLDRGGFDASTFYYANLAVDATTGASLGVSVHRGHFSGGSFDWEDVQTFDSPNNVNLCPVFGAPPGTLAPCDFYDKEALAASKDGSATAYVSLTNFQEVCDLAQFGFGTIEVWRTHDGGDSWQGPAVAGPDQSFITDPNNPACGFEGILQQSSAPAIGPNGDVYVVWQLGPTFTTVMSTDADIVVARSLNGGLSFGPPVKVADINSMRGNPPVGYNRNRINDHPRIAVATSGPFKGRVYVTFYSAASPQGAPPNIACPAGTPAPFEVNCVGQTLISSQVFVSYSDDRGVTWSAPVPAAAAPPATGVKRFWPVVTVEPGGNVDVVYYQSLEVQATPNPTDVECSPIVQGTASSNLNRRRRAGLVSSLVDTYWAQSTNGGTSFRAPIRMSTATSNWCTAASNIRPNFGDYIGATFGGNRVIGSWADGRNGVPDTFHATGLAAGKSQ